MFEVCFLFFFAHKFSPAFSGMSAATTIVAVIATAFAITTVITVVTVVFAMLVVSVVSVTMFAASAIARTVLHFFLLI
jgi:hypothetical protein